MEENQERSPTPPPNSLSTPANTAPDDVAAAGADSVTVARRGRGRPRKYDATPTPEKRVRGRPPGSGKIQKIVSLGGTLAETAGSDFTGHVVIVDPGENVVSKILSFFDERTPEAVCILSASGQVSSVVILQSGAPVRHEGPFEILSLNGQCTYYTRGAGCILRENVSLTISLAKPDGSIFGGAIANPLIAATPIQLDLATFKQLSIRKQSKQRNSSPKGDQDSARAPSSGSTPKGDQDSARDPSSGSMPEATPA